MTTRTLMALCAVVMLLPALAVAREDKSSLSTAEFVKKAEIGGEFEVGSSRLAQDKAKTPQVKEFAEMMIKDHTDANKKLREAAKEAGLKPETATKLDAKNFDRMEQLERIAAKDFDRLYMEFQRTAHQEAISLFQDYIESSAADGPLKKYAKSTLPILEEHLLKANEITVPST